MTLTVLATVGVLPVGGQEAAQADIADSLITSVAGYSTVPEGGPVWMGSGPATLDELAGILGADLTGEPAGSVAAYVRVFATPTGDGEARVMGLDVGDAAEFLAGFRDATVGATEMPLFPGEQPPLGGMVAYEIGAPGSARRGAVTALASDSMMVVLSAADPADSMTVLRQMVRDQAALTPPTAHLADIPTGASRADAGEKTVAYRLGRAMAPLFVVAAGLALVKRARRQAPARAGTMGAPGDDRWVRPMMPPPPPPGADPRPDPPRSPPPPPPPAV